MSILSTQKSAFYLMFLSIIASYDANGFEIKDNSNSGNFPMAREEEKPATFSEINGNWTLDGAPLPMGSPLEIEGTLTSEEESSSIDIRYTSGDIFRFKSGTISLGFGKSNISNLMLPDTSTSNKKATNSRFLKIENGILFINLRNNENNRKITYDISTPEAVLKLNSNSRLVIDVHSGRTTCYIVEGPVSVSPPVSSSASNWSPFELSGGTQVTISELTSGELNTVPLQKNSIYVQELEQLGTPP